jgi:hypothetical protein
MKMIELSGTSKPAFCTYFIGGKSHWFCTRCNRSIPDEEEQISTIDGTHHIYRAIDRIRNAEVGCGLLLRLPLLPAAGWFTTSMGIPFSRQPHSAML